MNLPEVISYSQARRIILAAQGLNRNTPFGSGPSSVIKTIEQLGYVQLDTISVVERAHHHILWSRIPSYQFQWLEDAQRKKRMIFEYWAHAAAYLPMKDYRYSLPVMGIFRDQKDRWPKSAKKDMNMVLRRIEAEGPLMSRDFESQHKGGSWWDWKPAKWALQRLFLEGHLMVSHREGFQRVYDLPERIIPSPIDTSTPHTREYYAYLILRTLRAQGLASRNELFHLRQVSHPIFDKVLHQLMEEGAIHPISVDSQKVFYTLPEYLDQKIRLTEKFTFLSPFDNSVIWRKRLNTIFHFDYTLECYVPSHKRTYGYFCLPILYKDQFVGRIDAKADRKNSVLQVKKIWWENNSDVIKHSSLFEEALQTFATFNQCDEVRF